jgi:Arc/MetJ family transcription regulator
MSEVRTNIVIDEKLMKSAMKAAGTKTKRETVELGLRNLVEAANRKAVYQRLLDAAGSGGIDPDYDVIAERKKMRKLPSL